MIRPRLIVPVLVRVRGRSMLPTFAAGDLLLAARGARPRPGRVAVLDLPPDSSGAPRPLAVKRLVERDLDDPTRWHFTSDNAAEGMSSTMTGPIPESAVRALVCGVVHRAGSRG